MNNTNANDIQDEAEAIDSEVGYYGEEKEDDVPSDNHLTTTISHRKDIEE